MEKNFFVYILANKQNGILYIGFTSDLINRVLQHKEKLLGGVTSRYDVDKLVFFEAFSNQDNAMKREKQLKNKPRQLKISLIEEENPKWNDLYPGLVNAELNEEKAMELGGKI